MIAANKRFLEATLKEGVLNIQSNLLSLYGSNLSTMGTQAALLAGFAFSAIQSSYGGFDPFTDAMSFVYFIFYTLSLVSALIVLTQTTIVTMFGPTKALLGKTDKEVLDASLNMRKEQRSVLEMAALCVTSIFVGAMFQTWVNMPTALAAILTIVYILSYMLLVKRGRESYLLFAHDDAMGEDNNEGDIESGKKTKTYEFGSDGSGRPADDDAESPMKMRVRGILWLRKSLEEGGHFKERFAVLDRGLLDFYKTEDDFKMHQNPINTQPFDLRTYYIETDPRKFSKSVTSLHNVMMSAVAGNDEFSIKDLAVKRETSLQHCSKHFKFALFPRISSELLASETIELMAHNERAHKMWMRVLKSVTDSRESTGYKSSVVEQTMRTGTTAVEAVVQAANATR